MTTPRARIGDIIVVRESGDKGYQGLVTKAEFKSDSWFYRVDQGGPEIKESDIDGVFSIVRQYYQ